MINKNRTDISTQEVKKAIIDFIEEHSYAPTVREIAKATGVLSTSTVHSHIKKLQEAGEIEKDTDIDSAPRALRVRGYKLVNEEQYKQEILSSARQRIITRINDLTERNDITDTNKLINNIKKLINEETH